MLSTWQVSVSDNDLVTLVRIEDLPLSHIPRKTIASSLTHRAASRIAQGARATYPNQLVFVSRQIPLATRGIAETYRNGVRQILP